MTGPVHPVVLMSLGFGINPRYSAGYTSAFSLSVQIQKQRSKDASKQVDMTASDSLREQLRQIRATQFQGYEDVQGAGAVVAVLHHGQMVLSAHEGVASSAHVVLCSQQIFLMQAAATPAPMSDAVDASRLKERQGSWSHLCEQTCCVADVTYTRVKPSMQPVNTKVHAGGSQHKQPWTHVQLIHHSCSGRLSICSCLWSRKDYDVACGHDHCGGPDQCCVSLSVQMT